MGNVVVDWKKLVHAYGSAGNIPSLLEQLSSFPDESSYGLEPWYSLWSSLYHQGTIYSASIAAVPEIVKHLATAPQKATFRFFALPVSIEIARAKGGVVVPEELSADYFESIHALALMAAKSVGIESGPLMGRAATAAFAASIGQHGYAELVLEISSEEVPEVFEWYWAR